ncbi:SDR family oxidoreductase [Nocardia sp. CA2R105]|uniref:SDR family NAD(P)-dependent oxidoreductase n=1 Tax=Nocardia coffeae TaxID=2873381 RepID=UPI001CA75033|nr:SDR family oxidoreductase [Nocardia coffeae]MBY8856468.1 SDR family oxidoreductase [Nocardia coffeae]
MTILNEAAPAAAAVDPLGFTGRTVLILGASSGIGQAAAARFSALGAQVVAGGRDAERVAAAVSTLDPERTRTVVCDVGDDAAVARSVAYAIAEFGCLDACLNNAGIFGRFGPIHEDTADNFDTVVGTNLRGVWSCLRHQIPALLERGGAIVNTTSVAAHLGHARSPLYSATKHAVVGLTKSVALQYARYNIRVNAISPGSTDTGMLRSIYPTADAISAREQRAPLRRLGTPAEIAEAAVWLASPASSYVTGQTLIADGGVTAGAS